MDLPSPASLRPTSLHGGIPERGRARPKNEYRLGIGDLKYGYKCSRMPPFLVFMDSIKRAGGIRRVKMSILEEVI